MQGVEFDKYHQSYGNEEIFCLGTSLYLLGFLSPRLKTSCQVEIFPSSPLTFNQPTNPIASSFTNFLPNYFYNCYLKSSLWYFMSGLLQQPHTGPPTSNFCTIQFFGCITTYLTCIKYYFYVVEHVTSLIKNHQCSFRACIYSRCSNLD